MPRGADQVAHVLGQADQVNLDLAKHLDGFTRVLEGNVGRRGNHDRTRQRYGLDQRESDVPGAGRQIDDEVIELTPFHRAQELTDDRVQRGTTPDEGFVAGVEKSDRDHLQSMDVEGNDAVFADVAGRGCGAEQLRHIRSGRL